MQSNQNFNFEVSLVPLLPWYTARPGCKHHRAQNRKIQHAKLFPTTAGRDKVTPFPPDAVPMAQRRKHSHNDCVFQDIREVPRSEVTFQCNIATHRNGSLLKQLFLKREVINLPHLESSPHHPWVGHQQFHLVSERLLLIPHCQGQR